MKINPTQWLLVQICMGFINHGFQGMRICTRFEYRPGHVKKFPVTWGQARFDRVPLLPPTLTKSRLSWNVAEQWWQNKISCTRFWAEIVFISKLTSLYQVVGMVGLRSVCDWQGWLWGLFWLLEGRASSPISCVVIDSYMYQYHWLARLHLVPITYIPETTASNAYTTGHTSHRSEVKNDNHST